MAKYKLARTSKGMKTVDCAILNENCLANTYLVQFNNGVIKDVPRYDVFDLDKIDEGVLDKLRALGKKVGDAVNTIFRKVTDNHVEYNVGKATIIDWVSVLADNAKKLPFIKRFFPGDTFADAHSDLNLTIVDDDDSEVDGAFIKDMTEMYTVIKDDWEEYTKSFDPEALQTAIEHYDDMMFGWNRFLKKLSAVPVSESLNEGNEISLALTTPGQVHVNAHQATSLVKTAYMRNYAVSNLLGKEFDKKAFAAELAGVNDDSLTPREKSAREELYDMYLNRDFGVSDGDRVTLSNISNISKGLSYSVYMFWGAPGVGKSQIISRCIKELDKEIQGCNLIELNALGMRKDDISFPVLKKVSRQGYIPGKDGEPARIEYTEQEPVDITKTWFPGWDSVTLEAIMAENKNVSKEDIIKELDNVANGGRMAIPAHEDEKGNMVPAQERIEGQGGIIFVDEFSRIDMEVMNSFMTIFQTKKINTMTLGSKWIFVCAGNRFSDLGEDLQQVSEENWEKAWGDRLTQCCFSPSFDEWVEWAEAGNVPRWIIEFLRKNKECWYNNSDEFKFKEREKYDSKYMKGSGINGIVTEKPARLLFPNPRQWDLVGQEYAKFLSAGYSPDEAKKAALSSQVGPKMMDYYFDRNIMKGFNDEDAANVIDKGFAACTGPECVPVVDQTEALGINVHVSSRNNADTALNYKGGNVLSKIFKEVKARHEQSNDTIISPNAMSNIVEYVYCCCIYIAKNGGAAAGSHVFKNCRDAMKFYIDDIYGEGSWDKIVKQGALPGSAYNMACERMQKLSSLTDDAILASEAEEEYKKALDKLSKGGVQ